MKGAQVIIAPFPVNGPCEVAAMLLRFAPCVLTALLLCALSREGASLAIGLFVLSAALPVAVLAVWADAPRRTWRTLGSALACAAFLLGVAALAWRGFSYGNPPEPHLGSLAFLGAGLGVLPLGLVELAAAIGVRRSAAVAGFLGAWAVLVVAPFFLPSYLEALVLRGAGVVGVAGVVPGAPIDGAREAEIAAWLVRVHPFAAACDAAGGLDGFRDPALYDRAEIGARHAYRYPSSAVYAALLWGLAALGAAVGLARRALSARRSSTP